jgi:2-polyprenyl-3-methyl-5-hydroxy-6-metoxy-1,4-benzoquinol methylase
MLKSLAPQAVLLQSTGRRNTMQVAPAQIRTEPRPQCYLCGATVETMHDRLTDFMFEAPGAWSFKKCSSPACGLWWLDPFPIRQDLHLAYQTYYTHQDTLDSSKTGGKLRDLLYQGYRFASSVPSSLVGLLQDRRRVSSMCLEGLPPGRLLDVGCGDGGFLNRARTAGWSVEGVEFDEKAVAGARDKYGVTVHHGDLISARFAEGSFDAITLNHVIEHLPDPLEVFAECKRILKPSGKVVMTTPNSSSLGHRAFQGYWRGLEPPRHLFLFSAATLRDCARRSGLAVVDARTTAANADIIIGASYSIRDNPDHRLPIRPPANLKRTVQAVLFQYREQFQLRRDPDAGEEAVLVCTRNQA